METRWREIQAIWLANQWLYLIVGILIGLVANPLITLISTDFVGLLTSLVPHVISLAIFFLVLSRVLRKPKESGWIDELRTRLLHQVAGQSNQLAMRGINDMRTHGWLTGPDGMLAGVNLTQVDLHEVDLSGANLQKTQLSSAHLHGSNFTGADLTEAELFGAGLQGAVLKSANLERANLFGGKLKRAVFREANLHSADLSYSLIESGDLSDANLSGAKLLSAMLRSVNLAGANLCGANLTNADLMNADLTDAQFDGATILPDATHWHPLADLRIFTDTSHPLFWRSSSKLSPAYFGEGEVDKKPERKITFNFSNFK